MSRTKNTLLPVLTSQTILTERQLARFLAYVDQSGGIDACWEWRGGRFKNGYGRFHIDGKGVGAHRIAFELWNGPLTDDLWACHDCPGGDHRWCVNPRHLWAGTKAENATDMVAKGRASGNKPHPDVQAELAVPYDGVGLSHPGEQNPWAKLTDEDVRAIRSRYSFRKVTIKMLAAEYEIHPATVKRILNRQRWSHLD